MKKPLLIAIAALAALSTSAGSPVRRTARHTQADGTQLAVSSEANGRYTLYNTTDGLAVLPGAGGTYYYATCVDGCLVPSSVQVHDTQGRTAAEKAFAAASALPASRTAALMEARYPAAATARAAASTADGLGSYGKSGAGVVGSIGECVIPVVMVDFPDRAFRDTVTAEKMTRFFNEEHYKDEPLARGSVRDYFIAQSGGLFSPRFEVVATVRADNGYAYYGKDGEDGSIDPNVHLLVQEALDKASAKVDFSAYADANGVPLLALVFAGPGQQSSFEDGKTDYIWGQFSSKRTFTANNGTVTVSSYLAGNELLQDYASDGKTVVNTQKDGIGLFCHEFGHALGLPDFYYTGSDASVKSSLRTMGFWSVMDYGNYYYSGYRPTGYTAYERSFLGWLDVVELDEPQYAELHTFGTEGKPAAYVIRNPENPNEYYLLENRRKTDWTPRTMGEGMLVTHIDYDEAAWKANRVNNDPAHQRMQFVPADNMKEGTAYTSAAELSALLSGYKGDLFPGTQGVTSLTDDTQPATAVFTAGGKLGRPLYNIKEDAGGVVSFSFRDPSLTGITAVPAATETAAPAYYTAGGTRLSSLQGAAPGVYIVCTGKGSRKVVVK